MTRSFDSPIGRARRRPDGLAQDRWFLWPRWWPRFQAAARAQPRPHRRQIHHPRPLITRRSGRATGSGLADRRSAFPSPNARTARVTSKFSGADSGTAAGPSVRNLSIPGIVLNRATFDLARSLGRDMRREFHRAGSALCADRTTHVTIFAGGNDANNIAFGARSRADPI